ncbi:MULTISPECIES: MerR family transcriptional regulator [unclassified Pseudonocardia]|uniref:helix-turn-helix domain-containing protein n=1 Tax=unclassified Pseudonocardia TaxID=2619320 RepID=UPI00031C54B2|nr:MULTISPECIES: MerR family transcriptional regulator [unclassified Pseudonocardia]
MALDRLDDPDYPTVAMGQAAHLLEVEPAFLRSLDSAGVVNPHRSPGGHRRYSRNQLEQAARLRTLLDDGHPLGSASWIDRLRGELADSENRLGAAHREIERLRTELARLRSELGDTNPEQPLTTENLQL